MTWLKNQSLLEPGTHGNLQQKVPFTDCVSGRNGRTDQDWKGSGKKGSNQEIAARPLRNRQGQLWSYGGIRDGRGCFTEDKGGKKNN